MLEERLRQYGAPVAAALRAGAPPEAVRDTLAAEGLPPHEDLVAWWSWRDGAAGAPLPAGYDGPGIVFAPETALVGPWHLLSLGDALRIRRWFRGVDADVPAPWVPVLQFEGQPVLCADASADGPAPLHVLDEGVPDAPAQFASLADFASTVLRLFDEGRVVPHPEHRGVPAYEFAALDRDLRRLESW